MFSLFESISHQKTSHLFQPAFPGHPSATPAPRVRCPVLGVACREMLSEVGWPHVCSAGVHSRQGRDSFMHMTGGLLEGRSECDPAPQLLLKGRESVCYRNGSGRTARFSTRVRAFS